MTVQPFVLSVGSPELVEGRAKSKDTILQVGKFPYVCANTRSMAATISWTWDRDSSNALFSPGARSISMTFSTPPAPIRTGTQK